MEALNYPDQVQTKFTNQTINRLESNLFYWCISNLSKQTAYDVTQARVMLNILSIVTNSKAKGKSSQVNRPVATHVSFQLSSATSASKCKGT